MACLERGEAVDRESEYTHSFRSLSWSKLDVHGWSESESRCGLLRSSKVLTLEGSPLEVVDKYVRLTSGFRRGRNRSQEIFQRPILLPSYCHCTMPMLGQFDIEP